VDERKDVFDIMAESVRGQTEEKDWK